MYQKLIIVVQYLMGLTILSTVWLRFANPEMTETQLLVNFWELWVLVIAQGGFSAILHTRTDGKVTRSIKDFLREVENGK